jgi:hypothetical protein
MAAEGARMGKLLDRLLRMPPNVGFHIHESIIAVWEYVEGYQAAVADAGLLCDDLRGFDEWVNLRMLLPPGSTRWCSRIALAAGTTHRHTYPHARNVQQRACWLFFEWLAEFAAERATRGVDAIIAEHNCFVWPEDLESCDEEVELSEQMHAGPHSGPTDLNENDNPGAG